MDCVMYSISEMVRPITDGAIDRLRERWGISITTQVLAPYLMGRAIVALTGITVGIAATYAVCPLLTAAGAALTIYAAVDALRVVHIQKQTWSECEQGFGAKLFHARMSLTSDKAWSRIQKFNPFR